MYKQNLGQTRLEVLPDVLKLSVWIIPDLGSNSTNPPIALNIYHGVQLCQLKAPPQPPLGDHKNRTIIHRPQQVLLLCLGRMLFCSAVLCFNGSNRNFTPGGFPNCFRRPRTNTHQRSGYETLDTHFLHLLEIGTSRKRPG